jgi:hypothetical protein
MCNLLHFHFRRTGTLAAADPAYLLGRTKVECASPGQRPGGDRPANSAPNQPTTHALVSAGGFGLVFPNDHSDFEGHRGAGGEIHNPVILKLNGFLEGYGTSILLSSSTNPGLCFSLFARLCQVSRRYAATHGPKRPAHGG